MTPEQIEAGEKVLATAKRLRVELNQLTNAPTPCDRPRHEVLWRDGNSGADFLPANLLLLVIDEGVRALAKKRQNELNALEFPGVTYDPKQDDT